ncbi:MAG: acyl-CoA dehydrogenase [Cyanobacteria bacterium P01_D01_bin.123]
MMTGLWLPIGISGLVLLGLTLGYVGVPLWTWSLYGAVALGLAQPPGWVWIGFGILALALNVPWLRRSLFTVPILKLIKTLDLLPSISETEREAIEAGTVWIEREFFSGKPDLKRLNTEPYPELTDAAREFLDSQVETVCRMATDWDIHQRKDLPPEVWDYLKQERFFGMMIPEAYGGRGFSNATYSAVMAKLASRSFTHTATVGVTNSLGPAKLLLHYGTPGQKDYYLPRLARGEEIPCFALTEPNAGSDAASITSEGVVFADVEGRLFLRLNWKKRYITLGAIATLIGLAFKLRDPDNLLGKDTDLGITVALIPADTPGVILGRRHDPLGVPFYNSPIEGRDVVVPIDQIIGGAERTGFGWTMLMQSLAAGRGISFPATCTGIAKFVTRVTGAYTRIRYQFGLPIGKFEGIEDPLARIGGLTYLMEAARNYTCAAVDAGEKPAVVAAIAKYQFTELSRQIVNDGMDIVGGSGICRGPRNLLANIYTATPIPITVEGANILTRSLMIFGQGAIRCHPYVYAEIDALNRDDLAAFDRALWGHLGAIARNAIRATLLHLTRGRLARAPVSASTAKYYRKLAWASASFALLSDIALLSFGGSLKRKEKLSGRFADILSWMYLGAATLRRYEAEGRQSNDLIYVDWSMQHAFAQIQTGFVGLFANMRVPLLGLILRGPVTWMWRLSPIGMPPSDRLGSRVARSLQTPGVQRDRLTARIYIPSDPTEALNRLERTLHAAIAAEPALKTIKAALRRGDLPPSKPESWATLALEIGEIDRDEAELVGEAIALRNDVVQVDSFTLDEYVGRSRIQPEPHPQPVSVSVS